MGLLEVLGFEGQSTTFDRITVLSGTASYQTDPPPGSASAYALRGQVDWIHPWRSAPSSTGWALRFSIEATASNPENLKIGSSIGSSEGICLSGDSSRYVRIMVAGVERAVSGSAVMSTTWESWVMVVDQQDGGTVEIYSPSDLATPVVSYTLTAGDITALGGLPTHTFYEGPASLALVDDVVAIDTDDATGVTDFVEIAGASIKASVFTGAGDLAEWSGTYQDIDEVPFSDSDAIGASSTGQRSDFSKAAIAEDQVIGVKLTARVVRTDTAAGENIRAYQRSSSTSAETPDQPAPAAGSVDFFFDTARDGTDWTAAKFDGETFGFESRT